MSLRDFLADFDAFLGLSGMTVDAIVVGRTALELTGAYRSSSLPIELLPPPLPAPILDAVQAFAAVRRDAGSDVDDDWVIFVEEPSVAALPGKWHERLRAVWTGNNLTFHALSRDDLLRAHALHLCERSAGLRDVLALAPTAAELASLRPWLLGCLDDPRWAPHVDTTLAEVAAANPSR